MKTGTETGPRGRVPAGRGTRVILAIAATVVLAGVVFVVTRRPADRPPPPRSERVAPPPSQVPAAAPPRAPAALPPLTGNPINTTDPVSGKPIVPGILSVYQGHTVGHCCPTSRGDWERLPEADKDAAIQRFLR